MSWCTPGSTRGQDFWSVPVPIRTRWHCAGIGRGVQAAANRRIEIVVHAVKVTQGKEQFAEKGQSENVQ